MEVMRAWAITTGVALTLFTLASLDRITLTWRDVLFYALLFRVIALFGAPILEDDHFRYLWDGWMVLNQGSPYGIAPEAFFDSDAVPALFEDVLDGINYPHVPTVYGPMAQWLFAAAYVVAPASVWPLQVLAAAADIGIILLLAKMVPLRWVLLYSWAFLVVKEYAFTAHIDVIGAFFLVLAIYLRRHVAIQTRSLGLVVGLLLAAATGIKVFCVLAVPFLLQNDWRGWLAYGLALFALAAPFGVMAAWLPAGLSAMGDTWLFNAPIYLSLSYVIDVGHFALAKWIGAGVLAGIVVFVYLRTCGRAIWPISEALTTPFPRVSVDAYMGALSISFYALFMFSPVFNPWYLVWWLPLACLHPSRTPWVCSVVLMLSYVTGLNLGDTNLQAYGQPIWAITLEFGAIFIALVWDIVRPLGDSARALETKRPASRA